MNDLMATFRVAGLAAVVLCLPGTCLAQGRTARLVDAARTELRAAKVSEAEIRLRLKIIENVATVKAYYPHADGGRPETRNSKFWTTNDDGSYIPRGRPTRAIADLWETESGIRCAKLSALILVKSMIDVADAKRLAELDEMFKGKVIPNELPSKGVGTIFVKPRPAKGEVFQTRELLPGDQIWFENPYFKRLSRSHQRKYVGQEGHHVFYLGGGKVMDMYSREPQTMGEFRKTFLRWKSVRLAAEPERSEPRSADFQIKSVRRVIIGK